jgi:hypothetical protein
MTCRHEAWGLAIGNFPYSGNTRIAAVRCFDMALYFVQRAIDAGCDISIIVLLCATTPIAAMRILAIEELLLYVFQSDEHRLGDIA